VLRLDAGINGSIPDAAQGAIMEQLRGCHFSCNQVSLELLRKCADTLVKERCMGENICEWHEFDAQFWVTFAKINGMGKNIV
jgi:hypothetical protein